MKHYKKMYIKKYGPYTPIVIGTKTVKLAAIVLIRYCTVYAGYQVKTASSRLLETVCSQREAVKRARRYLRYIKERPICIDSF